MNLNIRVSWAAWLWINSTAEIIWSMFAGLGYNVLTDIEYESRIKWWVNWFDINVWDKSVIISKYVDIFLVFDYNSFLKSFEYLKNDSVVFLNQKITNSFSEEIKNQIKEKNIKIYSKEINDKYDNTYLLAMLSFYLNIDFEIIDKSLNKVFAKKSQIVYEANQKIVQSIISNSDFETSNIKIENIWKEKKFYYWNKMVTLWAIKWELEYYSAYPMTPASSILTEIIKDWTVKYLQAEDEIAVINSALWASYTGARSAVWTSWGWFALMSEALSFAVQAEIPITVFLSMRAGPSTWTPTFFEQWDINFALNPTFWDFEHIVLYPSSIEECYEYAQLALNFADKYQSIVIMLLDKQLSEIHWTFDDLKNIWVERWIILENPELNYKRYELNESWVSPRVKVWTKNGDFIATSYEHDEFWATSEDPKVKVLMTEKRWKKLKDFYNKEWISWFEYINEKITPPLTPPLKGEGKINKKLIITTGVNAFNLKEFVKNNPDFWLIIIKILKPLDERLYDILKNYEEITFVESNYSWQLENYICSNFGLKYLKWLKISSFRKYDLYPFYYEDLEKYFNV